MWIYFCHFFYAETQSIINIVSHFSQKWETNAIYCSTASFFSEIFFGLVLIFGITRKSFEMFGYRSFTKICALILMEMSAWKADLSGDIDGAVMLLWKQRTLKRVFITHGYFLTYTTELLYMWQCEMLYGKRIVMHSSIQSLMLSLILEKLT